MSRSLKIKYISQKGLSRIEKLYRGPFNMADNKKTRWYTVQRNYDFETHDADKNVTRDITEDEWREEIKAFMHDLYESDKIKQYAMIFHDKDKLETGFKPIHVHMIVETSAVLRKSAAMALLGGSSDKNVDYADEKGARAGASRYLLHITEKAMQADKHIYGEDELIIEGGLDIHKMMKATRKQQSSVTYSDVEKLALQLSLEIEDEGLMVSEAREKIMTLLPDKLVAQKLWLDWQPAFAKSDTNYKLKLASKLKEKRELMTLYIYGRGGSGKSTLAQKLAYEMAEGMAPFKIAVGGKGKTFDFADGYDREKVTILDDVSSSDFEMTEFFQVFDPYKYNPVSSRNKNQVWLSDTAIFTTSDEPLRFVQDVMQYSSGGSKFQYGTSTPVLKDDELPRLANTELPYATDLNSTYDTMDKFYQVSRRFRYALHIEDDKVTLMKFEHNDLEPRFDTVAVYDWPTDSIGGDESILDETVSKILAQI